MWKQAHAETLSCIRFLRGAGDEPGAERMLEAVPENVGQHRQAQVRQECGYSHAAATPRTGRGWNAKQRADIN